MSPRSPSVPTSDRMLHGWYAGAIKRPLSRCVNACTPRRLATSQCGLKVSYYLLRSLSNTAAVTAILPLLATARDGNEVECWAQRQQEHRGDSGRLPYPCDRGRLDHCRAQAG